MVTGVRNFILIYYSLLWINSNLLLAKQKSSSNMAPVFHLFFVLLLLHMLYLCYMLNIVISLLFYAIYFKQREENIFIQSFINLYLPFPWLFISLYGFKLPYGVNLKEFLQYILQSRLANNVFSVFVCEYLHFAFIFKGQFCWINIGFLVYSCFFFQHFKSVILLPSGFHYFLSEVSC